MDSGKKVAVGLILVISVLKLGVDGYKLYNDVTKRSVDPVKMAKVVRDVNDIVLKQLGGSIQLARECGIPDDRMVGHRAAYDDILSVLDKELVHASDAEKRILGTEDDAAATFQKAANDVHATNREDISIKCPDVTKHWDEEDAKLLAKAQEDSKK